jgi:hypothetical protein
VSHPQSQLTTTFLVGELGVKTSKMALAKSRYCAVWYFLWGLAREKVYRSETRTFDELKQQIYDNSAPVPLGF